MTSHWMRPRPQWFDWQVCFSTDCTGVLPQTRPSVVSPTRMTPKRSRCLVVGCNNEHSSRYLLPTSEPLKKITFGFEVKALFDLTLRKCVYVRANHSWSSFIYRRRFLNESLQIAFPNYVLLNKFTMNAAKVNSLRECALGKRGAESAELISI